MKHRDDYLRNVILITVILFACYNGVNKMVLDLAPISWWVNFEELELADEPEQLVRVRRHNGWVSRMFEPSIPVTRYVKVQQHRPDGPINRCVSDVMSTSDVSSSEFVYFTVQDLLPARCPLESLEGEQITLAISWRVTRPYTVFKQANFRIGPYDVRRGRLVPVPDPWPTP